MYYYTPMFIKIKLTDQEAATFIRLGNFWEHKQMKRTYWKDIKNCKVYWDHNENELIVKGNPASIDAVIKQVKMILAYSISDQPEKEGKVILFPGKWKGGYGS